MTTGFQTATEFRRVTVEKFKAAYDQHATGKPKRKTFYPGQYSWKGRCAHYDKLCVQYPLLKRSLFHLAGLVVAQGVWFKPAVNKNDETYGLAEEALYRTNKFKREQRVTAKFYETVFKQAKYGGCFWEVTTEPFGFQIPPLQECIEPYKADSEGKIVAWRQIVNGSLTAEWTSDELLLLPFLGEETSTWPFAQSLLAGTETESEMLVGMEESAKDYSEKQAWPYEVLVMGNEKTSVAESDYLTAKSEWRNRKPGEGIATRNMPVEILPGGTGSAPIRELAVLCELMKDNIVDSTMIPPISKLYNSTEASSKEMTKVVMTTLGQPLQWRLTEYFEEGVLKPWIESAGFSRKSCPETIFESPDIHKKEEGEYWVALVGAGIQSPQQAAEHLGLEWDEDYWKKEEQKQMMQQATKLGGGEEGSPKEDTESLANEVWEVRKKK